MQPNPPTGLTKALVKESTVDIQNSFEWLCMTRALDPTNEIEALDDGLTIIDALPKHIGNPLKGEKRGTLPSFEDWMMERLTSTYRKEWGPVKHGDRKARLARREWATEAAREHVLGLTEDELNDRIQLYYDEIRDMGEGPEYLRAATRAGELGLPNFAQAESWDQDVITEQLLRTDKAAANWQGDGEWVVRDAEPTRPEGIGCPGRNTRLSGGLRPPMDAPKAWENSDSDRERAAYNQMMHRRAAAMYGRVEWYCEAWGHKHGG